MTSVPGYLVIETAFSVVEWAMVGRTRRAGEPGGSACLNSRGPAPDLDR